MPSKAAPLPRIRDVVRYYTPLDTEEQIARFVKNADERFVRTMLEAFLVGQLRRRRIVDCPGCGARVESPA